MEGMECFPPDSQDYIPAEANDSLLSISATSPLDAHEYGGSQMNLELTIDVGQTLVDLVADPPTKLPTEADETAMERRLRELIQSTEEKLRELDGRMQEIEKKATFAEGVLLQILQNTQRDKEDHHSIVMVPKPGGGPYEFGSRTASHSHPCQTLTTLTQLRSSTEKGKGPENNPKSLHKSPSKERSIFELFVPDSPTDEPDLVIDEARSTPRRCTTFPVMAPPLADVGYWSVGIPKLFSNISSMKTPTTPSNKDMIDQAMWNQVEPTTGLVGLYASGPSDGKPNKLAKTEQTTSTTLDGSLLTVPNLTRSGKPGSRRPLLRRPGPHHRGPSGNSQQFVVPAVPMSHDMQFRPTLDIGLSIEQSKLAAYVFAKVTDDAKYSEVLFHFAEFEIPREMFFSLIPPWTSHTDIINACCMLASMRCSKSIAPRVWFFPSHFAADVLREIAIKQPQNKYEYRWMPETSQLDHVFVPVLEPADGWYLMLLDIKALKVYVLDVCRDNESIVRRETYMTRIRNVVHFKHGSCDPSTWGNFNYPKDIPSELGSEETAVWCLYWLQQEGGFSTKILASTLAVRMRTAAYLIQSEENHFRGLVEAKAEHLWRDITANKD
ncbi:hypothetical protein AHAS_Ahas02G0043600 [Arachis hypogaea]